MVAGSYCPFAIMGARIGLVAAAIAPALMPRLLAPVLAFSGVSLVLGLLMARRGLAHKSAANAESSLKSPLDLGEVLRFALLLGVIMAAAKVLTGMYGGAGLLPLAALGGLADVDAVTLTAGRMVASGLDVGNPQLATAPPRLLASASPIWRWPQRWMAKCPPGLIRLLKNPVRFVAESQDGG